MKSKRRLSRGELMHTFLSGGVPAVCDLAKEADIDVRQVKRAIRSLEKHGHPTTNFEAWMANTFGVEYRKDTRRSVGTGDTRFYKATPHGSSKTSAYAKVPLGSLGIRVGATFKVSFQNDEIVISKA